MILLLPKLGLVAAALVLWFWTQKVIARKAAGEGLSDGIHDLSEPLHGYFTRNAKAADRLLLASSLFIDAIGITVLCLALFGPSFAPFIALVIVFGLRQILQLCCTLPPPPGMIWRDPGFPTALVTYGVSNDLFFSGHTALAVLGAIEICRVAPWWLGTIAIAVAIGEAFVVLVLRAHYTMDVIAGALAAWFAADMAARLAPWIDGFVK